LYKNEELHFIFKNLIDEINFKNLIQNFINDSLVFIITALNYKYYNLIAKNTIFLMFYVSRETL